MIRLAKQADLAELTQWVYTHQHTELYSGFMSLDKARIERDLQDAITHEHVLIASKLDAQGVLIGHCDLKRAVCDLAGPYVNTHNQDLGVELIRHWVSLQPKTVIHQFFFNRHSAYYQTLMQTLNASFQGFESILRLDRKTFVSLPKDARVTKMQHTQKKAVEHLHNTIFKDAYLDAQTLTAVRPNHTVYVLCEAECVIGYGLMKVTGSQASLEVFAVAEAHRGKQLSKPLISTMIRETLRDARIETVQLVVENVNEVALNLYKRMGFSVARENSSYHLQSQSVQD